MIKIEETSNSISKHEFNEKEPILREELYSLQNQLFVKKKRSVLLVFAGVDGGGKRSTVTFLNSWMDARWIKNRAYNQQSTDELERPRMWKYWRDLPPKGQIGMFLSAWYYHPLSNYRVKHSSDETNRMLDTINAFEKSLHDDGTIIIKFWMHLSKKHQKKTFRKLESSKWTKWQVTKQDWDNHKDYDEYVSNSNDIIEKTNTESAPWVIVDGSDENYRHISIAEATIEILKKAIAEKDSEIKSPSFELNRKDYIADLDLSKTLSEDDYKKALKRESQLVGKYQRKLAEKGKSLVLLFEGSDAAGKGGAIRRVVQALDPHTYHIFSIAAPNEQEKSHHYLWRFWQKIQKRGQVTIFDRSWYGRVLVERVEGFAAENEWLRAYNEINEFEEQLTESSTVLLKFWIQISKDEQLSRFKDRESTSYKSWKLTPDDWRNRDMWDEYVHASNDMIDLTNTKRAPWNLIEGNDKYHARIKVLQSINKALKKEL